tara:strand:- start:1076 stop:1291 length:216 start_codon:yes stop_codon:yes gene_type:complete
MKAKLNNLIHLNNEELENCNEILRDLPEDIKDIKELETLIGNNKDLSRAYDLGKKDTLEMITEQLKNIKKE